MRFEFATATRIIFGAGAAREVAPAARQMGTRALVVTGRSPQRSAKLLAELGATGIGCTTFAVDGEPTVELIERGLEVARAAECNLVVALGGGSVLDAAKAIAALLTNPGELLDYVEVVGPGRSLRAPAAPWIAVPTTAGTGAEVTRNAVLASTAHRVKASLRSPFLLPRLALVDPELTYDLPPALTASTGLDALTQLIEPYVSLRANPMTNGYCVEGLRRVSRSLHRAYHDGHNAEAREDMSLASLLSGLALANAGLGVVHGFAAPVGGMFPAPHGAVCAALLSHGMGANLRALRARAPASDALGRYQTVARLLTGQPNAAAEDGVEWVRGVCEEFAIPPLRSYGLQEQDVSVLVAKASQASSMKANPIALTADELREVLTRAMG